MITLTFWQSTPNSLTKGPMKSFRVERELLYEEPGRALIAQHAEHAWIIEGVRYLRIDCAARVMLRFEDDGRISNSYGPFDHLSFGDGICFVERELFATFHEDKTRWFFHRQKEYWASIVVSASA
jgi:hypothetical protein